MEEQVQTMLRDQVGTVMLGTVESLRISAAYFPMTAVAGDFYEFIPVDPHRVGFLVADVSGHGVPAALILVYSAAGHPPLLCWRQGRLDRIESNGLLIGVMPDSDYPVCEIPLRLGDRFLLYTDGVVEPESASGDPFGDYELENIVRRNQSRSPSELSDNLLTDVRRWQPASVTQQDDITLIVIDITQSPWNADADIVETSQASFLR